jgi:hypothetical protein
VTAQCRLQAILYVAIRRCVAGDDAVVVFAGLNPGIETERTRAAEGPVAIGRIILDPVRD